MPNLMLIWLPHPAPPLTRPKNSPCVPLFQQKVLASLLQSSHVHNKDLFYSFFVFPPLSCAKGQNHIPQPGLSLVCSVLHSWVRSKSSDVKAFKWLLLLWSFFCSPPLTVSPFSKIIHLSKLHLRPSNCRTHISWMNMCSWPGPRTLSACDTTPPLCISSLIPKPISYIEGRL